MDKAVDLLDKTLSKLEVTGEKVWPYLVQHEFVGALLGVIIGTVFVVIAVYMIVKGLKIYNQYDELPTVLIACGGIICILGLMIFGINLPNMMYPEAGVIYSVMKQIGGK